MIMNITLCKEKMWTIYLENGHTMILTCYHLTFKQRKHFVKGRISQKKRKSNRRRKLRRKEDKEKKKRGVWNRRRRTGSCEEKIRSEEGCCRSFKFVWVSYFSCIHLPSHTQTPKQKIVCEFCIIYVKSTQKVCINIRVLCVQRVSSVSLLNTFICYSKNISLVISGV